MLLPVLTAPPATAVLTLSEAKAQARIEGNDDDTYIDGLIKTATRTIEAHLGRRLITQTWAQSFGGFCDPLRLPYAPIQSVSGITYYDDDDIQQTVDASLYSVHEDSIGPFVTLRQGQSWPSAYARDDAVTATFVVGYGTAADVPVNIRHAAMMLIAWLYDRRHPVSMSVRPPQTLPWGIDAMLSEGRRFG